MKESYGDSEENLRTARRSQQLNEYLAISMTDSTKKLTLKIGDGNTRRADNNSLQQEDESSLRTTKDTKMAEVSHSIPVVKLSPVRELQENKS